jgi:hypothetical protein
LVHALDARVGNDGGCVAAGRQLLAGLGEELAGGVRFQAQHEPPGQDAPAEVVDGRVQVSARSVEQLDDRDVEVPILVGTRGTDALSGFGGVEATPGPEPSTFADEASPDRHGGKDPTHALGMQGEGAQGNGERDGLLGRSDGGQDRTLGLVLGHALGIEAEAREPD